MAKHENQAIVKNFEIAMKNCDKLSDKELLEENNKVIITVERDDTYSTRQKLRIFDLFTKLSNCAPKERPKYVRRLMRIL